MNIDFSAIAPVIEQLAAKLGVAAEHLWGVLVRQAVNDGVAAIITAIACFVGIFVLVKLFKWLYKANEESKKKSFSNLGDLNCEIGMVFIGLFIVTVIFSVIFYLVSGIKHLINPEYYAFMDIIGQFKK